MRCSLYMRRNSHKNLNRKANTLAQNGIELGVGFFLNGSHAKILQKNDALTEASV